jgi:hypothetical protein
MRGYEKVRSGGVYTECSLVFLVSALCGEGMVFRISLFKGAPFTHLHTKGDPLHPSRVGG